MEKIFKQFAEELQSGNKRVANKLFSALKKPLFGYLYRLSSDRNLSEDILQESLLSIYSGINTYNSEFDFLPWAYRVTRNCFLQFKRQQKKVVKLNFAENNFEKEMFVESFSESLDLNEDLKSAMNSLSDQVKETFVLKHFQNLTFKEIAEILDLPIPTVKSRVLFAIQKIRTYINRGES